MTTSLALVALALASSGVDAVPSKVTTAVWEGDSALVGAWLDGGGDPDAISLELDAPSNMTSSMDLSLLAIASLSGHEVMPRLEPSTASVATLACTTPATAAA